jgi:hypothetical protein
MGHVAVPEPTSAGRRGEELRSTWQHRSSTQQGGPWEVPELKVREHPPSTSTINVKMSTAGPREVPELKVRECNACGARPSGRAVNCCKNLGTNAQRVVRTHFTLTQVGHFY